MTWTTPSGRSYVTGPAAYLGKAVPPVAAGPWV